MPNTEIDQQSGLEDIPKFDSFLIGVQSIHRPLAASDFFRYKEGFEPIKEFDRNYVSRSSNAIIKLIFCDQTLDAYVEAEAADRLKTLAWLKQEGRERKLYANALTVEEFTFGDEEADHPYQFFWKIPRTWFPAQIAITKVFTAFAQFYNSPLNIDLVATPDDDTPIFEPIWRHSSNAGIQI